MKKLVSVVVVGLFCVGGCKASESSSAENPSASSEEVESAETSEEAESAEASEPAKRVNVTGNLVFSEGLWRDKTSFKPYTGGIYKLREAKRKEETVLWSGVVREGKRHGKWVEYFDNGEKETEIHYKNGEKHGKMTSWKPLVEHDVPDGKPTLEAYYKHGKKHGPWIEWTQPHPWHELRSGRRCGKAFSEKFKSTEAYFLEGKKHGPQLHFWYKDCELQVQRRLFVNGIEDTSEQDRQKEIQFQIYREKQRKRALKRAQERAERKKNVPTQAP